MNTAIAVSGMVFGLLLKSLFQKYFLGWLRSKPDNKLARLLLYGDGCTSLTGVWPAKAYQIGYSLSRRWALRKHRRHNRLTGP